MDRAGFIGPSGNAGGPIDIFLCKILCYMQYALYEINQFLAAKLKVIIVT